MLSYPAQTLHTNPGRQQRQQSTTPPSYDYSTKIQQIPVQQDAFSSLTRSQTTIHHRRGQSIDTTRAENAIRSQLQSRQRPRSREDHPQVIDNTGFQHYTHQPQHITGEAQQHRQARPGHYNFQQHRQEYTNQQLQQQQQQNNEDQRITRPRSLIGVQQFQAQEYDQRTIRPRSIAVAPAGLSALFEHQQPNHTISPRQLEARTPATTASSLGLDSFGGPLVRSQTFQGFGACSQVDGSIDSLAESELGWSGAYDFTQAGRSRGDSQVSSRTKTITPRAQSQHPTLPPTPAATPGSRNGYSGQTIQPNSADLRATTPVVHCPRPQPGTAPKLLSTQESTTSFPKPVRGNKAASQTSQRQVTAVYRSPISVQSSPLKPSESLDSFSSFESQTESVYSPPADSPESYYSQDSGAEDLDSLLPTFDFEGLRQAQLAHSESYSVQSTGVSTDDILQYIAGPDHGNPKYAYSCTFPGCSKKFGRKENIKSHVQTHLGDRQFVCTVCSKRFVRGHDLKRHAATHSGVNPYDCPCGKKFGRHDALTRHRQRGGCVGAVEGAVKREEKKRGRPRKERMNGEPSTPRRRRRDAVERQRSGEPSPAPSSMLGSPGEVVQFDFNDFESGVELPRSPTKAQMDIPLFAPEMRLDTSFSHYGEAMRMPPPPPSGSVGSSSLHSSPTRMERPAYTHSRANSHVALSSIFTDGGSADPLFSDTSPSLGYTSDFAATPPGLSVSSSPSMSLSHHFGRPESVDGYEMVMTGEMELDDGMQFFDGDAEMNGENRRLSAVKEEVSEYDSLFGDQQLVKSASYGYETGEGISGLFDLIEA